MADDEAAEGVLVAEFVLLRVDKNGHHLIEVALRYRLAEFSRLLLQNEEALELLLEAHNHVHAVALLFMVDEQVLEAVAHRGT